MEENKKGGYTMSDKQSSTLDEERESLSKGWIFAGIILFPLVPFVLIHFNKHLSKKIKSILSIVYFVFLFGVYQYACVAQGPVLSSVIIPDQYVTVKQGETYQIHYKTNPEKVKIESTHYSSRYANVASVDEKGLVQTITPGTTRITLTAGDNHHTYRKKYLIIHVIE